MSARVDAVDLARPVVGRRRCRQHCCCICTTRLTAADISYTSRHPSKQRQYGARAATRVGPAARLQPSMIAAVVALSPALGPIAEDVEPTAARFIGHTSPALRALQYPAASAVGHRAENATIPPDGKLHLGNLAPRYEEAYPFVYVPPATSSATISAAILCFRPKVMSTSWYNALARSRNMTRASPYYAPTPNSSNAASDRWLHSNGTVERLMRDRRVPRLTVVRNPYERLARCAHSMHALSLASSCCSLSLLVAAARGCILTAYQTRRVSRDGRSCTCHLTATDLEPASQISCSVHSRGSPATSICTRDRSATCACCPASPRGTGR